MVMAVLTLWCSGLPSWNVLQRHLWDVRGLCARNVPARRGTTHVCRLPQQHVHFTQQLQEHPAVSWYDSSYLSVSLSVSLSSLCTSLCGPVSWPISVQIGINLPPGQRHERPTLGSGGQRSRSQEAELIFGDIILDPLNRVDRGMQWPTEILPLQRERGELLHIVLTAIPAFVVYASCWRTCIVVWLVWRIIVLVYFVWIVVKMFQFSCIFIASYEHLIVFLLLFNCLFVYYHYYILFFSSDRRPGQWAFAYSGSLPLVNCTVPKLRDHVFDDKLIRTVRLERFLAHILLRV